MRRRLESWVRPIAGVLALALALAGATPAAASEATPEVARPTSLAASASATVAAMPISALAQAAPAAQASATADSGKSFFKTGAGKIALVLMLAGTSYMVYSAFKDNDPVKSQFR